MTDLQFNGICEMAEAAQCGNNAIKCFSNIHLLSARGDLCSDSSFHDLHTKITFNSQSKANTSEREVAACKTTLS